ncbi:hypothetical protein N7U49_40665 [Streptomyces sp. AD2-2]|nr:hypothetical protein N7U49_40665 [Streptomyces sp. AD2-2]
MRAGALAEERRAEQIRTVLEFVRFTLEAPGTAWPTTSNPSQRSSSPPPAAARRSLS